MPRAATSKFSDDSKLTRKLFRTTLLFLCGLWAAAVSAVDFNREASSNRTELHWAFKPISRPALSQVVEGERNMIDRFIRAKLNENHLTPAPESDRRSLIRRLSFDFRGIPPTP